LANLDIMSIDTRNALPPGIALNEHPVTNTQLTHCSRIVCCLRLVSLASPSNDTSLAKRREACCIAIAAACGLASNRQGTNWYCFREDGGTFDALQVQLSQRHRRACGADPRRAVFCRHCAKPSAAPDASGMCCPQKGQRLVGRGEVRHRRARRRRICMMRPTSCRSDQTPVSGLGGGGGGKSRHRD